VYPYEVGVFADVGESKNAQATIQHLADSTRIDSLLLAGDMSYASGCESSGCTTWDAFQRMLQPLTSRLPVAVEIGNHEEYDSANGIIAISARYRFSGMPYPKGSPDDLYYFSWNAGPAHFISLGSFYSGGFGASSPMTKFLNADFAAINKTATPWTVVMVHAPWYNSNKAHTNDGQTMRKAYESMFIKNGVSIIVSGHVHAYQRSFPVDNLNVVADGAGIVHLNCGDGGAGLYKTWLTTPKWSAINLAEWGHGELVFYNSTWSRFFWIRNADPETRYYDDAFIKNVNCNYIDC